MSSRPTAIALGVLLLAGCQAHDDLIHGPQLTPVGDGLAAKPAVLPASLTTASPVSTGSLWGQANQNLFRDLRASRVGDVVTVLIAINDEAQFDNESGRSRTSNADFGLGAALSWMGFGYNPQSGELSGNLGVNSSSTSHGEGKIDRAEKLRLSVAAVVTEVLPNGNLVIRGSQEVRVNYEVRVLEIGGIVRPLDIASNNVIAYDKIAEARISYGGRGRLTDVQQPAFGQRVYDSVVPF